MLRLVFDNIVDNDLVVPNLVMSGYTGSLAAPYINYPEIINFLRQFNIRHRIYATELSVPNSFYPISIFYFDFNYDYFKHISHSALTRIRKGELNILFIYGEPDHPFQIHERLNDLCKLHSIPFSNVYFISGNTIADTIANFAYFNEDLALHYYRNRNITYPTITTNVKEKKFTLLCRTKKNWRTDFVFSIWNEGMHTDAYVSHSDVKIQNDDEDELDLGVTITQEFLDACPLTADTLTVTEHNDHTKTVYEHNTNSYFNIVLETFIDCEDTTGVFLTEKTWKAIRNGQMFVIVGCANSLKHLHELGFKTFHGLIDESYDEVDDVKLRWQACLELNKRIARKSIAELHELYLKAIPILQHNQLHFQSIQKERLESLIKQLSNQ